MSTLTSRLIVSLTDRFSGPAKGLGASLAKLRGDAAKTNAALLGRGSDFAGGFMRQALAIGAGYVGITKGIGGTIGAAIKFEDKFADVRKVLNGTPADLAKVRSEILEMSKRLPNTAEGIADIFAAAAQSNIPLNELGKFSEMVAKVAVAWDVTEADTSDALAKIKNQLHMNVDQIGLYADAINHLSNNTASHAPDLVDFSKRVAANGEMFGFAATETLAFGGAMIAAGGRTEVAATSFRNMGRALTIGTRATKMQRTAFSRLGLDAVKTAKNMQKNALKTTLNVIERIQKLPEWERISIASALFGDEARALMPVISNTTELRRQLGLVAEETHYAGSAYTEYLEKAETTANALKIIGNKVRAVGIDIGDGWLPTIKEIGAGLGDVLDTLDKRVGVFDELKAGMQGFLGGLGYGGTGGVRQLLNDLGDLMFGKAFGHGLDQADERVTGLARISNRMRTVGKNLREFAADISAGNISNAIGSLGAGLKDISGSMTITGALALGIAGRGLLSIGRGAAALALSTVGRIAITAVAVAALIDAVKDAGSLGEFADNLGKLSTIEWAAIAAGIAFLVGPTIRLGAAIRDLFGKRPPAKPPAPKRPAAEVPAPRPRSTAPKGSRPPAGWRGPWGTSKPGLVTDPAPKVGPSGPRGLGTPQSPNPVAAMGRNWGGLAKSLFSKGAVAQALLLMGGEWAIDRGFQAAGYDTSQVPSMGENASNLWQSLRGIFTPELLFGKGARDGFSLRDALRIDTGYGALGNKDGGPADVNLLGTPPVSVSGAVETRPAGIQAVRITNPMPAPQISVTVHATTNASPQDIAGAVTQRVSDALNALSRAAYSDGVE